MELYRICREGQGRVLEEATVDCDDQATAAVADMLVRARAGDTVTIYVKA